MNLYLIRHALPDYENDSITELGKTQTAALAEWLKDIKEHCHCMPRRCDFSPYFSPGQHSVLPFYFAYGF